MSAIDVQNAKQIRDAMDVVIQLDATATSYGDVITITNENLIRATVSLRSDLTIIEPTLPESEINVEAYWPEDVAEAVAAIPDDTPITYTAGYPGDMSPVRKFYVSGQVTWANNVLTIHGVDAVHFLGAELPASLYASSSRFIRLRAAAEYMLNLAGVTAESDVYTGSDYASEGGIVLTRGVPIREYFAFFNWAINSALKKFWYVDAGRPKLSINRAPTSATWAIAEEDCADPQRSIEPKISKATILYNQTEWGKTVIVGSFDWTKEGPAFLTLDDYVSRFDILSDIYSGAKLLPMFKDGDSSYSNNDIFITVSGEWGSATIEKLYSSDTPEDAMIGQAGGPGGPIGRPYSQVIPWSSEAATSWQRMVSSGKIASDQHQYNQDIAGLKFQKIPTEYTYDSGAAGASVTVTDDNVLGTLYENYYDIQFPNGTAKKMTEISNVTGSFRWKGDPRHQPRDVATFVLRDGTEETITLENITIQHEKGGTYADYTYRKGIV